MAISNNNNYQVSAPQYSSSGYSSNDGNSRGYYGREVDSIYSTTPFVGTGSIFSPSQTARESITPRNANDPSIRFEFPPELLSASSSEASSTTSFDEQQERALVPYQPAPQKTTAKTTLSTSSAASSISNSSPNENNRLKIRVPRSQNPFGADAVHPRKKNMKKQRKRRTAAGAVGGMVAGGLVLGPVGVVVGAAAGAAATNRIHKARERAAQRKYEQVSFQRAASRSIVHRGAFA